MKYLMVLLVAICAVFVSVSAEPQIPGVPDPKTLGVPDPKTLGVPDPKTLVPALPPLSDIKKMLCSRIQKALCCDNLKPGALDTVKAIICADVQSGTCPDATEGICSANTTDDISKQIPMGFLLNAKNAICCDNQNVELIQSVKEYFCTKAIKYVCCDDIKDIDSAKKILCPGPCDKQPCKNCGACSYNETTKNVTCKCFGPYFGDRCQYKCCEKETYQWIKGENGTKPAYAVNGCYNGTGDVYVARAFTNIKTANNTIPIPGKLITADMSCYSFVGPPGPFKICRNYSYEVLNDPNGKLTWVKANASGPPICAVEGVEVQGPKVYIGRTKYDQIEGTDSTGKVIDNFMYFVYGGRMYGTDYGTTPDMGFDYLICKETSL